MPFKMNPCEDMDLRLEKLFMENDEDGNEAENI